MGKTYLRYKDEKTVGVIASTNFCEAIYGRKGEFAISPALKDVILWNLKKNEEICRLTGGNSNVNSIALSPDGKRIAVGYHDGEVAVYKRTIEEGKHVKGENFWECEFRATCHSTSVVSLAYNWDGSRLASGSADTDIVIWDTTANTGLFKLRGHKDRVTGLVFLQRANVLISSSKDTLVKIWELDTQHCIQTLVGTRHEIWSIAVDPQERRLVVGSIDHELRIWNLELLTYPKDELSKLYERDVSYLGSIFRKWGTKRVFHVKFSKNGQFLAVHGDDYYVEVFNVKLGEAPKSGVSAENAPAVGETFTRFQVLHHKQNKFRSVDFHPKHPQKILITTTQNQLEEWSLNEEGEGKGDNNTLLASIDRHGHRTPVRALALSSDDRLLISASAEECKLWNTENGRCLLTMECGYALCATFLPGNKHVIVGTKEGHLELFDLASRSRIDIIYAHKGPVYSVALKPNNKGIISGSADKSVKMWDFELVRDESSTDKTSKRLGLSLEQTMMMDHEVLCVRCSIDGRFLAISLLDSTVKIFYLDTMKFFLSLFGHKLPVMSIDISSDSSLIVTASSDKNIKIWGLDFGDCHKSIFAHNDGIMGVSFVRNTHYIFSISKDGAVKYWDADNYELIQELREPHSDSYLWALAVSSDGERVYAAGHERAVFSFSRTDEPLFLEEEKEKRMEAQLEKQLEKSQQFRDLDDGQAESANPAKRVISTIKAGEQLVEDIELVMAEKQKWEDYHRLVELFKTKNGGSTSRVPPPEPNVLLLGMDPDFYLWQALKRINWAQLDIVLSIMTYSHAAFLLRTISAILKDKKKRINIELASKIVLSLMQIHHNSITADASMAESLFALCQNIKEGLRAEKNLIGFNKAALFYTNTMMKNKKEMIFGSFDDFIKASTAGAAAGAEGAGAGAGDAADISEKLEGHLEEQRPSEPSKKWKEQAAAAAANNAAVSNVPVKRKLPKLSKVLNNNNNSSSNNASATPTKKHPRQPSRKELAAAAAAVDSTPNNKKMRR